MNIAIAFVVGFLIGVIITAVFHAKALEEATQIIHVLTAKLHFAEVAVKAKAVDTINKF